MVLLYSYLSTILNIFRIPGKTLPGTSLHLSKGVKSRTVIYTIDHFPSIQERKPCTNAPPTPLNSHNGWLTHGIGVHPEQGFLLRWHIPSPCRPYIMFLEPVVFRRGHQVRYFRSQKNARVIFRALETEKVPGPFWVLDTYFFVFRFSFDSSEIQSPFKAWGKTRREETKKGGSALFSHLFFSSPFLVASLLAESPSSLANFK